MTARGVAYAATCHKYKSPGQSECLVLGFIDARATREDKGVGMGIGMAQGALSKWPQPTQAANSETARTYPDSIDRFFVNNGHVCPIELLNNFHDGPCLAFITGHGAEEVLKTLLVR